MGKKLVNSQCTTINTYRMYLRQMTTLAENVFLFENINKFIDIGYVNSNLIRKGSIAFFKDELMGLLALPYRSNGKYDIYGRPTEITVFSYKNNYTRTLKNTFNKKEFIIMYDNNGYYPIYLDLLHYAERITNATMTIDINISQQKTPRFWKTKTENLVSVKKMLNDIDDNVNSILTYDNIDIDDTTLILEPSPYISDKVQENKEKIWNEFLRLIGVANANFQKKERNIKDEIFTSQGGTIASRFSRFEPRSRAIEEINNYFNEDIELKYYDGLPTNLINIEDYFEIEKGDDNNETNVSNKA